MEKALNHPLQKLVIQRIIEMRKASGLSQREFAKALGTSNNLIGRLETGERKIEFVELYWICQALDEDPAEVFSDLVSQFQDAE